MIPTRRDLHFGLTTAMLTDWHAQGPYVTHFANALSISFPAGERFFIHTVRHYRDHVRESGLEKAVAAFIGQEAMHSREHEDYNRLLAESGLPATELEAHAAACMKWLESWLPPSAQLAVTLAQEHFTAILAEQVLTDPRVLEGADPRLAALWRWHALEETEHKAVAFDVFESVMGRGPGTFALRAGSMLLTTAGFLAMVLYYQRRLLRADARARTWRDLGRFARFMFASPGLLPRLALPWLRYFRPDFHPWNHDNRHLLAQIDALLAGVQPQARLAA